MKTFKCDGGKMVMLDNSSGDFYYKNDVLVMLYEERDATEGMIKLFKDKEICTDTQETRKRLIDALIEKLK